METWKDWMHQAFVDSFDYSMIEFGHIKSRVLIALAELVNTGYVNSDDVTPISHTCKGLTYFAQSGECDKLRQASKSQSIGG